MGDIKPKAKNKYDKQKGPMEKDGRKEEEGGKREYIGVKVVKYLMTERSLTLNDEQNAIYT